MAATIAEVSGGRFVLALGAGWNEREFAAHGLPYDRRVGRFEEAWAIIRGLLAGERVTLDGRFWQADDAVLLPRPASPPPLMIGSNGPRMLSIALPHADWWNTWFADYGNTAEGFAALDARISEAARTAGRAPADVGRSACAFVLLDRGASERAAQHPRRSRDRGHDGPDRRPAARTRRRGRRRGDRGREPDHGALDPRPGRRRRRAALSLSSRGRPRA